MNAKPAQWNQASADLRELARDQWGAVDLPRGAVPAALQGLRTEQSRGIVPCAFCCEPLMPNEKYCSRCLHQVAVTIAEVLDAPVPVSRPEARVATPAVSRPEARVAAAVSRPAAPVAPAAVSRPESHDAPPVATPASGRAHSGAGAMYTLESSVRCPQCETDIRTLKVLRVLRTQVSFTSTLPRKGYVIVCPECDHLLSAELSGLI